MKRFLLSAIAIFAMSMCTFAQSIVCTDNACTPITDQTFSNTSVPYYCPQSLTFEQGQAVDVCITIMCPETTNVTAYGFPATAQIQSLTITGFSNLPEGLSYCVSRVDLDPTTNVYATIHITGTAPSTNEDYDLELSGIFTGTASAFSQTIPLENENVTFATGIVLTIGEGQSLPSEIVCDDPCPAVTNQPMSQTTIPYYAPEELTYNVNEAVDVCITIQCPANTNVEYMGMQAAATITSMTITGFSNLPDGLSYCVSRVDMDPTTNNYATLHLTGTPTTANEYDLNISCNVTGTANVMGNNVPLNNQAVTFPTGIVVTIEEETSNSVVANFTTNPEATQLLGGSTVYITAGQTITYTNTSENATSIAWTFEGGNPATSTENTVTVTYATAGVYTTTLVAYGENDTQNTKTIGVNVSEPSTELAAALSTTPAAEEGVVNITVGGAITFTDESQNADSIAWTFEGGNLETSSESSVEVTYATAGTYTARLVAFAEDRELTDTATVSIIVSEEPVAPEVTASFTTNPEPTQYNDYIFIEINAGETITYNNTSQNAASIAWTFEGGNPATSTENIVTVTYVEGGVFSTALTAYNEDQSESNTKTITVYVAEIIDNVDESAISEINVYPNPTSSVINIAAEGMQNITIMDMAGRVVMSKDVNSNFETIDAEGFSKANYMVRIATTDGVVVKNIVVE
ncbi:MAG: PKD domain-containing protein [Bacteroidales bacterium]|nr:PKD domain-containing protein [Bacteroidales bacterium]